MPNDPILADPQFAIRSGIATSILNNPAYQGPFLPCPKDQGALVDSLGESVLLDLDTARSRNSSDADLRFATGRRWGKAEGKRQ